jgi:hypothetical protein
MNWLRRLSQKRILDVGALIFALIFVIKLSFVLPQRAEVNDFAHYYVSSRFYLEGLNPYATFTQPLFESYGFRFSPDVSQGSNPPLLLLIFSPLTMLSPKMAFLGWVLIQAASLAAILILSWRLLNDRMSLRGFRFLCAGAVGSTAVFYHFFYSQVQLPLAALTLAAFAWLKSGRSVAACSAATLVGLVKLYPLALVPWFIWHGGKDAYGRLKLVVLCLGLAGLVVSVTGIETWQEFSQRTPEFFKTWIENRSFNFTLPSFVINLGFSVVGFAPSVELKKLLWKVAMGCGLSILAMAYAMCWRSRHYDNAGYREKEFSLLCTAMLAGSLIAWGHYFVFLIFPFTVAALQVAARPSSLRVLYLGATWMAFNFMGMLDNPFLNSHLVLKVLVSYVPLYGMLGLGIFFGKELRLKTQGIL